MTDPVLRRAARHDRRPGGRPAGAPGPHALPHPGLPLARRVAHRELLRGRGLGRRAGLGGHRRWGAAPRSCRSSPRRAPSASSCPPWWPGWWPTACRSASSCVAVALVEVLGMGLVALLSSMGLGSLWLLAAVAFTTGMAMAFYYPAYSAWLPALVPESRAAGGQRLRGHGPAHHRPGGRTGRRRGGRGGRQPVHGVRRRGRQLGGHGAGPVQGAADTHPARPRRRALDAPRALGAARHARGVRLHGAHALAAGDAAVRLPHGAGHDGPARGADPVPRQGRARRRPDRPRLRAGRRSASAARSGRSSWRRCGCRAATSR